MIHRRRYDVILIPNAHWMAVCRNETSIYIAISPPGSVRYKEGVLSAPNAHWLAVCRNEISICIAMSLPGSVRHKEGVSDLFSYI